MTSLLEKLFADKEMHRFIINAIEYKKKHDTPSSIEELAIAFYTLSTAFKK